MSKKSKFKFDVVIGNPPYQEETIQKKSENGQATRTNIFQKFQEEADKITNNQVSLIYPGARWLHRSGKGMKKFGLKQINDNHLKKVIYYPNATQIFSNVDITDGITIVEKNMTKESNTFEYEYITEGKSKKIKLTHPGEKIIPLNPDFLLITNKIDAILKNRKFSYLSNSILPRNLFGIESDFVENNPDKVKKYAGNKFNLDTEVKLLTNGHSGSAGRAEWFIVNKTILNKNVDLITKYKVVVSSAHPGGQNNRDNKLTIIDNYSAFGRSRVALKIFDSLNEAKNFYNYMQTNFIKFTLLLTDEKLTSFAKWTPDILNYKDNTKINFSNKDVLNKYLYKLFDINLEEKKLIEEVVKNSQTKGDK